MPIRDTVEKKLISMLLLLFFSWWLLNANHSMKLKSTINTSDLSLETDLLFSGRFLTKSFHFLKIWKICFLAWCNLTLVLDSHLTKSMVIHGCRVRCHLMKRFNGSLSWGRRLESLLSSQEVIIIIDPFIINFINVGLVSPPPVLSHSFHLLS